jgi:hypothetical protein
VSHSVKEIKRCPALHTAHTLANCKVYGAYGCKLLK